MRAAVNVCREKTKQQGFEVVGSGVAEVPVSTLTAGSEEGGDTYHNRACPQPLHQPAVLPDAELPVLGSVHATEHVHDLLVVARLLLVLGDLRGEREEQHAAGCEDVIAERLGVGQRDGVVGELDGLAAHNLRDLSCNRGRGEGAIDDMGRAEGFEEGLVVRGGCSDDGRKLGEPRYLDGCMRVWLLACACMTHGAVKESRITHHIGRRKKSPRG